MMRGLIRRLRRDERGLTIIEFAFIAPTLLLLLMGTFDLGYRAYVISVLQGEVQKAARDGTLETGAANAAAMDARVQAQTSRVVGNGTFSFERKFFPSFTRAGQAETFSDGNSNGVRDPGECFQDENNNATWDNKATAGKNGQGGADDIVVYTASVTYPRLFPLYGFIGGSSIQLVSATTVLRNQPFGAQAASTPVPVCT